MIEYFSFASYSFFIGVLATISTLIKNKNFLKSDNKFNLFEKIGFYSSFVSLFLGLLIIIINFIIPLEKSFFSFIDFFIVIIVFGGLSLLFWNLYKIGKFQFNLPKTLDIILFTIPLIILLINLSGLLGVLKILSNKSIDESFNLLLLFLYLLFVPYVACIYGVNSVAKSKNRDNVTWTIFAAILIHSLIILIIISLLEKVEKPKFK
jgi:putative effector of murein hydrolase LrgA (UPF0299 family)